MGASSVISAFYVELRHGAIEEPIA
jgi:hypothetical protein